MKINQNLLKSIISNLLIKANTVLDKEVFECLKGMRDFEKRDLILENCKIANETKRPLCQDTGQVLIFLKLPFNFSFGYDFKEVINDSVCETYKKEFYRKSIVKNAIFDRRNTNNNAPAIIYTDFENRNSVRIDVLIKGGGAENMSFVEMFNPTASEDEIINKISTKVCERAKNACPPLFIGIGAGGTMDYAALLSKKALFEGVEDNFCKKLKENCLKNCDDEVLSIKILSSPTHIASMPIAVTINCHSNRHAGCEIRNENIIYDESDYTIQTKEPNFSEYKKVSSIDEIKNLKAGEKVLFSSTLFTMRDAAHKRVSELLEKGGELPFEIKNSVIFYAGPAPKKDNEIIGPIGPTTAKRMDKFAPKLYDIGCIATIGKGSRSEDVKAACERNKAHYLTAQGGIACFLQKCFKKAELVAFEDLGAEAIYKIEVENLPLEVIYYF